MGFLVEPLVSPPTNEEEARLRAVLDSRTFRRATALRALLVYLCEHRGENLNEYAIAVEALGRRTGFDPKSDATVRVHVARLRQKLKEFYETEAPLGTVRFELPAGTYQIQPRAAPEETPAPPARRPAWSGPWLVTTVLALVCILLVVDDIRLRRPLEAGPATPTLPVFWRSFFAAGKPTRIVIPTPVFFQSGTMRVRDVRVNDFAGLPNSKSLSEINERWGGLRLNQSYAVASDLIGAIKLSQYLARHGQDAIVGATGDLPLEAFRDHNIIFLGIPATSTHLQGYLEQTNFYLSTSASEIQNRKPQGDEPAIFRPVIQSEGRSTRPGLIALLPGRSPDTRILVLAGLHTASLASFLLSPQGLESLERIAGTPFFEVVVAAEIEGATVLRAKPLAYRAISP